MSRFFCVERHYCRRSRNWMKFWRDIHRLNVTACLLAPEVAKTVADPTFQDPWYPTTIARLGVCPNEATTPMHRQFGLHPPLSYRGRTTNTSTNLPSWDHVSEPPSSRIVDLTLPVFPRITLPRFSVSPSGIGKMLERRLASSEHGNDRSNTVVIFITESIGVADA
jgi:hypothetical protein